MSCIIYINPANQREEYSIRNRTKHKSLYKPLRVIYPALAHFTESRTNLYIFI